MLKAYLPKSRFRQHGERDTSRNFYWRQSRDMKGSPGAKLLMLTEAAVSLVIATLVIARAITILA